MLTPLPERFLSVPPDPYRSIVGADPSEATRPSGWPYPARVTSDDGRGGMASALSVTVLGSAGTFPQVDNPCSGYLVRTPSTTIWVDAGPGTFAALQGHVALADVDAIVLSHEHPDHWIELPVVRNAARYVLGLEGIAVFGTGGT